VRRRLTPDLLQRNRDFRSFWSGQTISLFGDQISLLAIPLLAVLTLDAGPAQMGYLTAVGLAPNLLALHAGAWIDRQPSRRRLMLLADIGRAVLLATIPVAAALGALTLAQLYAVAFGVGCLTVLFFVSYNTLFVALLERGDYVAGSSLLNGSRALSLVAGQGAGGVLVALLTAPIALLADAASFVASAFFLRRTSAPEPPPADAVPGATAAGVRFIARTPVMRAALGASATLNLFNFAFFAIFILYATRELGIGPAELGVVLAIGALGGVVGSLATGWLTRRLGFGTALVAGFVLFPAPLMLVPLAGGAKPIVLLLLGFAEFVSSIGVMVLDIGLGALFAAIVPDPLRARVSGAYTLVNYGVRPIGALLGGGLASAVGMRPTLWIATIGALAGVLWLLPSPLPRLRQLPGPAPVEA
jgi:predicted MFS family arabinose efflux permease